MDRERTTRVQVRMATRGAGPRTGILPEIALAAFVIGLRTGGSTRNERFRCRLASRCQRDKGSPAEPPRPNSRLPTTSNSQLPKNSQLGVGDWAWLVVGNWELGIRLRFQLARVSIDHEPDRADDDHHADHDETDGSG